MSKSQHQCRVEEFMRLAKQEIPEKPTEPSKEIRLLRAKLIMEEALETIKALGVGVVFYNKHNDNIIWTIDDLELFPEIIFSIEQVADGCADLSVVTIGTLSACGIHDTELLEEVDKNNLAKFGPGHSIREDGKLIKPANHQPPNIKAILDNQK